ncbi:hypothetical protein NKDENANG_03635 [Candidatus Entotheonellaceae bacterium PAL068K]
MTLVSYHQPPKPPSEHTMVRLGKHLFVAAGWLCLSCGFFGIFLPLLPTTPFILLAAFCFSKGSASLHRWLLTQKTFGPIIRDWQEYGVIRRRVKWTSICLIVLLMGYAIIFRPIPLLFKIAMALVGISIIGFIGSRPSQAQGTAPMRRNI